jgi:hypothetical protein
MSWLRYILRAWLGVTAIMQTAHDIDRLYLELEKRVTELEKGPVMHTGASPTADQKKPRARNWTQLRAMMATGETPNAER